MNDKITEFDCYNCGKHVATAFEVAEFEYMRYDDGWYVETERVCQGCDRIREAQTETS